MTEALIKAHYYIENISLHTIHPKDGGVSMPQARETLINCGGHLHCDILETFTHEDAFRYYRVRVYMMEHDREVIGWTWSDHVRLKIEEPMKDGRFNRRQGE